MQTTYYATEPARLCGMDAYPSTPKRREAAAALAQSLKKSYTIGDVDTAAVIYNTVREAYPEDPIEFLLGAVFAAGIERGRERERDRQRRAKRRREAQQA